VDLKRVTLINKKGCEVLGFGEQEIIGKDWIVSFVPERDRFAVRTVFTKLMSGEIEAAEYYENPVLTKSGGERIISWYNTVLKNSDGKIIGVFSSGEDITDRKKAEEKVLHLNLALRAIRNVGRLIIKEKNPETLIKGICDNLTETRGYYNTWIALFDRSRQLITTAESGLNDHFSPIVEQLRSGSVTYCGRRALDEEDAVAIKDPASTCTGCPLSNRSETYPSTVAWLGGVPSLYRSMEKTIMPSNIQSTATPFLM